MKKVITVIIALALAVPTLWGQGTVTLGTGTATNGTTAHPTPYGTYYKNHRVQYLILANEITSLGMISGNITAIGFNVANLNTCSEMPNYTMKVKLTTASVLTTTFDNEGYTTVWTHPNFLPVAGWNTHTFTTPLAWDGTSNILVDVCFDIIPGTYTQNASVFFSITPTNLASFYRSDTQVACGTTAAATVSPNRANMQITGMIASCVPPANLTATNPTTSSVVLGWTPVGTETTWNLKYGAPGFDPNTGGTLISGITANPYTLEGLTPITNYQFYVQADCGAGSLSNWGGPGAFLTTSAPLGGSYTINSTLPTGGSNFNNFTDFANAMNLGGFSAPVVIDVAAGTGPYTNQVILGQLPNSSAVNTLTINGNGQTLQFLSTNTNERATLKLNGTDYVTVDNLIIKSLGTTTTEYGFAVQLMNNADYNTFTNCQFIADVATTSTNYAAFVTSNSATGATTAGTAASYLTVQNCIAVGGFYGIVINGPTTASGDPLAMNNVITNNQIKDFHSYGLYLRGQGNGLFSENQITRTNRATTVTLYMVYFTQSMTGSKITKNKIYDFAGTVPNTSTGYGIYSTAVTATVGQELLIANNLIYGWQNMNAAQYGLYLLTTDFTKIYHNTVSLDHASQPGTSIIRALHHSGNLAVIDIRNNIFSVTTNSAGTKYILYFAQTGTNLPVLTSNNNVLHMGATAGTNHIGYWNGASITTLTDWQGISGGAFDQNSLNVDPMFTNALGGNLSPLNPVINNIGANLLAFVPDDINGVARTATPDPGAYEFSPVTCTPPTALVAANITTTAVHLSWTPTSGETMWNLEYGLAGFQQGSGILIQGITNNPYALGDLNPATAYSIYVQANCGGGDLSLWAGPLSFVTECEANAVYPFEQNFEGSFPPICWNMTGGTQSFAKFTTVTPANSSARANFWGWTAGNSAMMTSPALDLSGLQNTTLSFKWSHLYSTTYPLDELNVLISNDGGTTWTSIWNKVGADLNSNDGAGNTTPGSFVEELVDISAYNTKGIVHIRFHGISGYGPDLFIDDVTVNGTPIPTGYTVNFVVKDENNVHINDATVTLGDVTNAPGDYTFNYILPGTYFYTVSAFGFIPTSGSVEVIDQDVTVNIVMPALIVEGTITLGTGTAFNTTLLHPTPYGTYYKNHRVQYLVLASELYCLGLMPGNINSIGFEVANVNNCSAMPNYTIKVKQTTASVLTTTFDNEPGYVTVWTHPDFLPVVGWNTHTFINTFEWDGTSNLLIDICFDLIPGSFTQNASVYYTPTSTNLANFYRSDSQIACGTTTAATVSPNRANMQIAGIISGCMPPTNLAASNPSTNSIVLNWMPGGSESSWNMKYGAPGFDPNTSGTLVSNITSVPYTLTGLDPVTNYEFVVQAICGSNVSSWACPGSFLTTSEPLSGAYTINSTLPTGGTNFANFTDFANAINLGGFAGPVTVDVVTGTGPYTEQVMLGQLPNSSATNSLVINGNGEILQFLSTNTNERATLKLNGTDYITVDNLIIKALGSTTTEFGWAVWLTNNADYNTFTNCQFIVDVTLTSLNYASFVTSSSATGATTAGIAASYLTVQNCVAIGGYYGMVINGPTTATGEPPAMGNVITNNQVKDFHLYGLYLRGQVNGLVSENVITRTNRATTGTLYMLYLTQTMTGTVVTKNRIYDFVGTAATSTSAAYGIYGTTISAAPGQELLIANNLVYGFTNMNGAQYGMYLLTTDNTRVYHNTISLDHVAHTGSSIIRGIHHSGNLATIDIRNNIISVMTNSTGIKYCLYFAQTGANLPTLTSNNNVLYMGASAGTNHIGFWDGASYTTFADWQTVNGGAYDQNSVSADPMFVAAASGDYTPDNPDVLNIGTNLLAFVPDDINGVVRSTTPDPGAFEAGTTPPVECEYEFILYDTYGDGWNGATMQVIQDGIIIGILGEAFTSGFEYTQYVALTDGLPFSIYWNNGGAWAGEVGLAIIDPFGQSLYNVQPIGASFVGTTLFQGVVACAPPACAMPTGLIASNITINSAQLGWQPGSNETSWNLIWGEAGFDPTSQGTFVGNLSVNSYLLEGLSVNMVYCFYVQAICPAGGVSTWAGPYSFTTLCNAFDVPFAENFDTTPILTIPECWSRITNTVAWRVASNLGNFSAPNTIATYYNSTLPKDDWFFTPGINLVAGKSYNLSFYLRAPGWQGVGEKLKIMFGAEPSVAGMSVMIYENTNIQLNEYTQITVTFAPATSGAFYLGWHAFSVADLDFISIDNIEITEVQAAIPGDANCDGSVNVLDVMAIAQYIIDLNPQPFCFENADVNGNGVINVSDLIATINIILGSDLKSLYTGVQSASANIYLSKDAITLNSDGTLSGLQFELVGLDASQLQFLLPGFEFITNTNGNKLNGVIFSMNNKSIPAGKVHLFTINGLSNTAGWGEVTAANTVANEVKVMKHTESLAGELSLSTYPNPTNGLINARLILPEKSMTVIKVVDVMGREVHTLHNGNLASGQHTFNVDLSSCLSKGIYFMKLDAVVETNAANISKLIKLVVIE